MSSSAPASRRCNRPGAPMPHSRAFPPRPPSLVLPLTRRSPRRKARPSALATHTSPAPAAFPAPAAPAASVPAARVPAPHKKSARLPAEVLKLRTFSFLQSNSNFFVSLPNVKEKDVKGLLFRKQPITDAGFRLFEIGKAFQTLQSAYRT